MPAPATAPWRCPLRLPLIDHSPADPAGLHRHLLSRCSCTQLICGVTTYGRDTPEQNPPAEAVSAPAATTQRLQPSAHYLWAMLLARLFESLPLVCPNCGADIPIIVFVPDVAPVAQFLNNIGVRLRPL